jgi:hypothetical protein
LPCMCVHRRTVKRDFPPHPPSRLLYFSLRRAYAPLGLAIRMQGWLVWVTHGSSRKTTQCHAVLWWLFPQCNVWWLFPVLLTVSCCFCGGCFLSCSQGFKSAMLSLSNCTLMLVNRPRFGDEDEMSSSDDEVDESKVSWSCSTLLPHAHSHTPAAPMHTHTLCPYSFTHPMFL